ncbi:uncharacterized protein LOC125668012 isoform X5 [Ostrea edulis]|uniref:uncharacterized protein LOC125668012 isoform X5 n=1 Tax=Ostrea edulis TaxID=37623 RepID=UPI0024AEBB1C|nr:uncharacterized protein LOC125668012 isoform X5 [Ostrea edulis]
MRHERIYEKLEQIEEHLSRILSFEEKLEKIVNITEFLREHGPGNIAFERTCSTKEKKFKSSRSDTNHQTYEKYRQCVPDFHVKVLQKNHKVLVNELCIRGPVIDDLIENEAIYHSDQETIMSCGRLPERSDKKSFDVSFTLR